jgi:hypothetical protein
MKKLIPGQTLIIITVAAIARRVMTAVTVSPPASHRIPRTRKRIAQWRQAQSRR